MVAPQNGVDWDRWRGRIDTKLEQIMLAVSEMKDALEGSRERDSERRKEIYERLNALERFQSDIKGRLLVVTGLVSVAAGAVASAIVTWVTR